MPLWVLVSAAALAFALLAALIVMRVGWQKGTGQVSLWAVTGAAGFGGAMIKYTLRTTLSLFILSYVAILLLTGFQPHRIAESEEARRSQDPTLRAIGKRYQIRFIVGLVAAALAIFFLLGQPGMK